MKKILLIEDDPMIGKILELKLLNSIKEKGLAAIVIRAKDGITGLNLALEELPDMILTDLMLPKKSGFELLSALKEKQPTHNAHVIVLSNLSSNEEMEKAKALGVSTYFVKSETSIGKIIEHVIDLLK